MCGISGTVNWGDSETLDRMTRVQAHRGPDDSGVWIRHLPDGGSLGLGSRRLSIIDLSPKGHMPMANERDDVCITFNGEIYNFQDLRRELRAKGHQFRSNTDTEVVLRLYEETGTECLNRLNGMFAFAIFDLRHETPKLFLARDHFGVKPLYYVQRGARFAFASEIKSLLQLPDLEPSVDSHALHQYLTLLWVPDPKTMFEGIQKLPAGHYAIFRGGELVIQQYWDLRFPAKGMPHAVREADLVAEVRDRFRRSVQAQMISDVPIGAFLSAGMDSSSIVAMMSQSSNAPVKTYTITFPEKYRVGEMRLDDPAVARRVAQHFGCEHHEIVVEPQVAELLPKLLWHMDEPVADPAILTAYLVCREARKTVTVLLSGVGGDELFAGYRKHYSHFWAESYRRLPNFLRRRMIEPLVRGLPAMRGTPLKGLVRLSKKMMHSASLERQDSFLMNCTYLDETQKSDLYAPSYKASLDGADPLERHRQYFERVCDADFLNQMLYLDTKAFMVSLNLTYNDKMSMASSVEVRVPFLDRELAEFVAWEVPPQLKLKGFLHPTTKYIFRKAMQDILPQEVLRQPKAGFFAPVDHWLALDLKEMTDDLLSERRVRDRGYFEFRAVRRLVEEHRAGRHDWAMQIWQLLTLELWMQTFIDSGRRGEISVMDTQSQPVARVVS